MLNVLWLIAKIMNLLTCPSSLVKIRINIDQIYELFTTITYIIVIPTSYQKSLLCTHCTVFLTDDHFHMDYYSFCAGSAVVKSWMFHMTGWLCGHN